MNIPHMVARCCIVVACFSFVSNMPAATGAAAPFFSARQDVAGVEIHGHGARRPAAAGGRRPLHEIRLAEILDLDDPEVLADGRKQDDPDRYAEVCREDERRIGMLKDHLKHDREALTDVGPLVAAYVRWAKDCPDRWGAAQDLDPEIQRAVEEQIAAERQKRKDERQRKQRIAAERQGVADRREFESRVSWRCRSIDLAWDERHIIRPSPSLGRLTRGTVCDPKDKSNSSCTDLLCLRGTIRELGVMHHNLGPGGIDEVFPEALTWIDGEVSHWRKDRWQEKACHVSLSILANQIQDGIRFASDAAIAEGIDQELTKCLQGIRQE